MSNYHVGQELLLVGNLTDPRKPFTRFETYEIVAIGSHTDRNVPHDALWFMADYQSEIWCECKMAHVIFIPVSDVSEEELFFMKMSGEVPEDIIERLRQ